MKPQIDICLTPSLYPIYPANKDTIVIVADIFRATSSMCTALANGAESIIPVATTEEALMYKQKGYLIAAERNSLKCEFADFGNSPYEFEKEKVEGKTIVFTTTNGTKAIFAAQEYYELLIGSFLNIAALASYCLAKRKNILVLCAGDKNQINLEDTLFAGAFIEYLSDKYILKNDVAYMASDLWCIAKNNVFDYLKKGNHTVDLLKYGQEDDIIYCLQQNMFNFVPVFKFGCFKLLV